MLNNEEISSLALGYLLSDFCDSGLFRVLDFRGKSATLLLDIKQPSKNSMSVLYIEGRLLVRTFPEIWIWNFWLDYILGGFQEGDAKDLSAGC